MDALPSSGFQRSPCTGWVSVPAGVFVVWDGFEQKRMEGGTLILSSE